MNAPSPPTPPAASPSPTPSTSTAFNRMAISTIAPAACDTLQAPTRLYSLRRSVSPNSSSATADSDTEFASHEPNLSSDVTGLHNLRAEEQRPIVTAEPDVSGSSTPLSKSKGKEKEMPGRGEDWLQPPGRKLCHRHQRMADEGTNQSLQKTLDSLPFADRAAVSQIWSSFSASSHSRRALMLQGILTMCCQSELSLLSEQLTQINRIDPFSLLPRELALKILGFVDAKSLTRAAQVSRFWKSIADDDILWKNMCEQHIEKQCHKCGWGLPLLERRAPNSGSSSPVGAGVPTSGVGQKRFADDDTETGASSIQRPSKRLRSRSPLRPIEPPVALLPPPRPSLPPKIPSSSPFLHPQHPAPPQAYPLQHSLDNSQPGPSRSNSTRPWKDVYSERLTIARNWRLGRSTMRVLKGHTDGVMCLQYNDKLQHPSFPILITGSYDRTVRVWNMETSQEVLRLIGHTRAVRALQFDECKLVTGSMDRTLRLWNWRTGQCIRTLEGHTAGVVCLSFDSNILVSGSVDRTVKVWNFRTGDCFTLRGHMDWVNSVKIWDRPIATSPDADVSSGPTTLDPGKMLFSASDDGTIRLWDLTSRTCVRQFEGHVGQVQSIQLAVANFEEEAEHEAEEAIIEAAAASSTSTEPQPTRLRSTTPDMSPTTSTIPMLSSSSPVLISGSLDNTIRVWDVETGKRLKTLFGHIEGVWAVASDKLRLVSGSHDKTIKIWNRGEGKCTATLVGHRGAVTCLSLADDKIVSGSDDGDIRIWSFGGGSGGPGPIPTPPQ